MNMSRRVLLAGGLALAGGFFQKGGAAGPKPTITVYLSPT